MPPEGGNTDTTIYGASNGTKRNLHTSSNLDAPYLS